MGCTISEFRILFVSCTSRSCKMLSFRNFLKSVMFYISKKFVKWAGFFQTWPTFIEYRPNYNVLPVSSAPTVRHFSRLQQIKSYKRSTKDEIRLSDLSVLNAEKDFSENLYFNSVVDTFAKMKNRQLV